ncbi:hypothetical protein SALBM311S_00656 [Streptomyces alboniger]
MTIHLPDFAGGRRAYEPRPEPLAVTTGSPFTSRTVFSAAHVVADPYADTTPDSPAAVDWDATLAFRRHLWSHGLGVAEAMDTAQRGMGLDWAGAAELSAGPPPRPRRSAVSSPAVSAPTRSPPGRWKRSARPTRSSSRSSRSPARRRS